MGEPGPSPVEGGMYARLRRHVNGAVTACADLVIPPCCLICRARLTAHHNVCPTCWKGINFIRQPLCDVLGIPLPYGTGDRTVSAAAVAHPPAYDRARAAAHYGGEMRTLVHRLKFADRQDVRLLCARWLQDAARDLLPGIDLIVPVPLSRLRLLLRQFNQAALLASELSRRTGVPMDPLLLRRTRSTRSQVGLTRDQRRRNVAGAFGVPQRRRKILEGRNVLLIDDVITTGATVDACARVLRRAGAARIDVAALAMVTKEVLAAA
jgi:ComF family protein